MVNFLDKNMPALKFNEAMADAVDLVCKPLMDHIGITHFGHIKIFNDSSMLRLANNAEWSKRYFENSYYNDMDLYSLREVPENESRVLLLTGHPSTDHCAALCYEYDIWNALIIYEKFADYSKFWFFGTQRNNTEIINYYANNVSLFKKYAVYFEERFRDNLINFSKEDLISTNIEIHPYYSEIEEKNKEFLNKLKLKKYHFMNNICFSAREAECMHYLSCGKTVKEIGNLLGLSPRTVESHIVKVKNKIGCNSKSQIIKLFEKERRVLSV
ncbi:MAG: LuxR C-terminal-related transcriptional regulator [Alphaproteobacteria bacterium]|nr:LuxR C-terminal-related transcriptional regulator [Alphaproteobacteria bacterium]